MKKWMKQDADLKILESLYRHKYLRAKTLAIISGKKDLKRGYERVKILERMGLLESKPFRKTVDIGTSKKPRNNNRKVATIYYLTRQGIMLVKDLITGEEISETERTRPPEEESKDRIYRRCILFENLGLDIEEFVPVKQFKEEYSLTNFIQIDMIHRDTVIFFAQGGKLTDKRTLIKQSNMLRERYYINKQILILTENEGDKNALIRFWKDNYGMDERILCENDYQGIRHLINPESKFENYLASVADLKKPGTSPKNCAYMIDGQPANIYDLVGLPQSDLRKLNREKYKAYICLTDQKEIKILEKIYPEILKKNMEIFTLAEIGNREEIHMLTKKTEPEQQKDPWANIPIGTQEGRWQDEI